MKYCYQYPFHILSISCLYPPIVNKRFKEDDFYLKIINIICVHFGLLDCQMAGKRGKQEIADARHIAMFFINKYVPKMTLTAIGKIFKRDHSTVISAKQKCMDLIDSDKKFNKHIIELTAKIDSYIQRTTL